MLQRSIHKPPLPTTPTRQPFTTRVLRPNVAPQVPYPNMISDDGRYLLAQTESTAYRTSFDLRRLDLTKGTSTIIDTATGLGQQYVTGSGIGSLSADGRAVGVCKYFAAGTDGTQRARHWWHPPADAESRHRCARRSLPAGG